MPRCEKIKGEGRVFGKNKKSKGFTLLEVLIAIGILSIIALAFFPLFSFTARNIQKSQAVTESTYIAQSILEDYYNKSIDSFAPMPVQGIYEGPDPVTNKYWLVREIRTDRDFVKITVRVFENQNSEQANSEMELHLKWANKNTP